jgi:hypothetical protein
MPMMGWATALELLGGALVALLALHLIAGAVNRERAKVAAKKEKSKTATPSVELKPATTACSQSAAVTAAATPVVAAPAVSAPVAIAPPTIEPPPNEFSFPSPEPIEPAAVAPAAPAAPTVTPVERQPIEPEIVVPAALAPAASGRVRVHSPRRNKRVLAAVPPKRKARAKRLSRSDGRRPADVATTKAKLATRRPKRVEAPRRKRKLALPKVHVGRLRPLGAGVGRQLELT